MNIYLHNLRLPSEYQEVEYIESTGTQYIDTGYKPTTYPKIDFTFLYVGGGISSETWLPLFGRRDYYGYGRAADFALFVTKASPYYLSPNRGGFDPGTGSGVTISKNTKYNIVIDKGQFYLDGVLKSGASTNNTITSSNYPVFLFDNNDGGSRTNRNTQIRLYSCKLYNSGVLERDLVPCYRKSDSVIGMYDLVNNQFYTNSGTGTFGKGNDVTMSEVQNIYIGEYSGGYTPTANTILYLPLATNSTDQTGNYTITESNITYSGNKAVFNANGTSCLTVNETSFPNTFTLHLIAQITTLSGYQLAFRQADSGGYDDSRCYLYGYSSGIQLGMANGYTTFPGITADGNEHLYSFVLQSSSMKFYIDGVLKYTYNANVGSYANAKISFGNRWYRMNEGLKGTMREVIAESTYWTDAEVLALAQFFGFAS